MVLGSVLGLVPVVLLACWFVTHRRRSAKSDAARPHLGSTASGAENEEREMITRLRTGELTRDRYLEAMARLAVAEDDRADDLALLLWRARLGPAGDDGPRDLLARLAATLPTVLPGVLCTAAVLASTPG